MTKQQFQAFLDHSYPGQFVAHGYRPDFGPKGYYRKDLGPAFSFRGFPSWLAAARFLGYID